MDQINLYLSYRKLADQKINARSIQIRSSCLEEFSIATDKFSFVKNHWYGFVVVFQLLLLPNIIPLLLLSIYPIKWYALGGQIILNLNTGWAVVSSNDSVLRHTQKYQYNLLLLILISNVILSEKLNLSLDQIQGINEIFNDPLFFRSLKAYIKRYTFFIQSCRHFFIFQKISIMMNLIQTSQGLLQQFRSFKLIDLRQSIDMASKSFYTEKNFDKSIFSLKVMKRLNKQHKSIQLSHFQYIKQDRGRRNSITRINRAILFINIKRIKLTKSMMFKVLIKFRRSPDKLSFVVDHWYGVVVILFCFYVMNLASRF